MYGCNAGKMTLPFAIIAVLVVAGAVAAMSLRSLVHCVLALAVSFASLAALYLLLGAQFVGLAQILIYVGAVAILAIFAILLTRNSESGQRAIVWSTWCMSVGIAAAVFLVLAKAVLSSESFQGARQTAPLISVKDIGDSLMRQYVLPLELVALLLTAATIGAVIIAMKDRQVQK